jgi:hypothetical protein
LTDNPKPWRRPGTVARGFESKTVHITKRFNPSQCSTDVSRYHWSPLMSILSCQRGVGRCRYQHCEDPDQQRYSSRGMNAPCLLNNRTMGLGTEQRVNALQILEHYRREARGRRKGRSQTGVWLHDGHDASRGNVALRHKCCNRVNSQLITWHNKRSKSMAGSTSKCII